MKNIFNWVLFSFPMLCSINSYSQKSLSEQIDVVREYKPILENSEKIKSNPEIETSKPFQIQFNYTIENSIYDTVHKARAIPTEKMGKENLPKLLHSRLLIGGGNYGGFISEYAISNLRNKNTVLNFNAKHLSHNPSGEYSNLDVSNNSLNLFGKKIFKNSNVSVGLNYDRLGYNFYGKNFKDETSNIRQILNIVSFNTNYNLIKKGDSTTTKMGISADGYLMGDAFSAKEKNIKFGINIFDNSSGWPLEGGIDFDLVEYTNNSGLLYRNYLFNSKTIYHYIDSNFDIQIGFKTNTQYGTLKDFKFFPHLTAEYKFTGDVVSAFGGVTGKTEKNSIRNLLATNPYLSKDIVIRNTTDRMQLFLGLRANFAGIWGISSSVNYYKMENMPFYFEENVQPRRYQVKYDSKNGSLVSWNSSINISPSERFRIFGHLDLQNYYPAIFERAFYFPTLKGMLGSTYNIGNKFYLGTETFVIGERSYLDVSNEIEKLDQFIDANLSVDYKYSKAISAFVRFNNLFQGQYQYWNNYPVFGFNILGGLNISF